VREAEETAEEDDWRSSAWREHKKHVFIMSYAGKPIYTRSADRRRSLISEADLRLFKSISSNPYRLLRHYFRHREPTGYSLRPRAHSFDLPAKDDRNFIPRLLYGVLTQPN